MLLYSWLQKELVKQHQQQQHEQQASSSSSTSSQQQQHEQLKTIALDLRMYVLYTKTILILNVVAPGP